MNKTPHEKCPCEAFTMCDQYYQDMDPIVKDAWRFCVKKRGMSGYGLFMKECLCLLIAGYNFPIGCSPSGGYNCLTVEPGDEEPPLEEFIGQAHVRYRCMGPPDWLCKPSPSGAYENLDACQAVCHAPPPWPPGDPCEFCSEDTPSKLTCVIDGLTGAAEIYNGTYVLPYALDCIWEIQGPPFLLYSSRPPPPEDVVVIIIDSTGDDCTWKLDPRPPDCYVSRNVPWLNGTGIFAAQNGSNCNLSTIPP